MSTSQGKQNTRGEKPTNKEDKEVKFNKRCILWVEWNRTMNEDGQGWTRMDKDGQGWTRNASEWCGSATSRPSWLSTSHQKPFLGLLQLQLAGSTCAETHADRHCQLPNWHTMENVQDPGHCGFALWYKSHISWLVLSKVPQCKA